MDVDTIVVGPLATNCYVVSCRRTGQGVIVDPGADAERIIEAVSSRGTSPVWILNTHGHADHIGANRALKQAFPGARLAIHPADSQVLTDPRLNLSLVTGLNVSSPPADEHVADGGTLEAGRVKLEVIHTPGHTPGGISLYRRAPAQGDPALFSGDALFAGGIGRTDLPGADLEELLRAIRARLFVLPDDCPVYPGHGPATTIGREKRANPFL